MVSAKAIALASFLAEQIAKGKGPMPNLVKKRAKQEGLSVHRFAGLICNALRANNLALPPWLEEIQNAPHFKSRSEYREYLAKQKGFKSHPEYQEHLAKNRFVSMFASLLEGGMPVDKAVQIVLPLTRKSHFPIKKLIPLADLAVARSRQKKLPAHLSKKN